MTNTAIMYDDTAMPKVVLVAHNVRSCLNVGSLLRTAEGLGIEHVYLTGYTPYPLMPQDARLPHLARKIANRINKSALGAEDMIAWSYDEDISRVITQLKNDGYEIVALEQDKRSVPLPTFKPKKPVALIVGREVEGIEPEVLAMCGNVVEIPMAGRKESFNVAVAAAMALYQLCGQ